ncbi:MAG: hypothetical protein ACT4QC_09485 [Planctomycetaceae bacterium]
MQLRSVVELAALVSAHSPLVIERGRRLPRAALSRFWCAHRVRSRVLAARLDALFDESEDFDSAVTPRSWSRTQPLLADALAGDLLVRIWGAILTAADCQANVVWGGPLAKSLMECQQPVRHRVLRLLHEATPASVERLAPVDRLRRRLERWTDVLTGHLVERYGLDEFAFHPERARDFGEEQLRDSWQPQGSRVWDLYLVSLRTSFPETVLPGGRLADLRREQLQAMLAGFEDGAYDATGLLLSPRMRRLLAHEALDQAVPGTLPNRHTAPRTPRY